MVNGRPDWSNLTHPTNDMHGTVGAGQVGTAVWEQTAMSSTCLARAYLQPALSRLVRHCGRAGEAIGSGDGLFRRRGFPIASPLHFALHPRDVTTIVGSFANSPNVFQNRQRLPKLGQRRRVLPLLLVDAAQKFKDDA